MAIKNQIQEEYDKSINDFREHPNESLGSIFPVAGGIAAVVGFLVAYIMFIVNGGYTNQIEIIEKSGFNKAFTWGTVPVLYGGVMLFVIGLFLVAQAVVTMRTYFQEATKSKKAVMITDLILIVLAIITMIVFDAINDSDEATKTFYIVFTIVSLVLFFTFIGLILSCECRWMAVRIIQLIMVAFIILPVLLLFLENVIPLVIFVIVIAALFLGAWITITIMKRKKEHKGEQKESPSDTQKLEQKD